MASTRVQQGEALLAAFNALDLSLWQRQLDPSYTASYPGLRDCRDAETARAFNAPFLPAFSDLSFIVHRAVADGDRVIYTWTARGTHDGPLATPSGALPASGKVGSVDGVLIATVRGGRIVREETRAALETFGQALMPILARHGVRAEAEVSDVFKILGPATGAAPASTTAS